MARFRRRWLVGLAVTFLAGCAAKDAYRPVGDQMVAPGAPGAAAKAAPPAALAGAPKPATEEGAAETDFPLLRKLIYHGKLDIETPNVEAALAKAQSLARQHRGYLTGLTQSGAAGAGQTATITFRVPSASFESALAALSGLAAGGGLLRSREVTAEDVSEEWVDLESRVRNKHREEDRLLELLGRSGDISHLLEVEKELARVRGEIEQAEGRLRFLAHQVSYSTIELTLTKPQVPVATAPVSWWLEVWHGARYTFVVVGKALVQVLAQVLALAPYFLLLGGVAWLFWRRRPST
ncbi:MAG: DUF4349 domain-containing protein [Armatimonadetes bacterium]|nr:DUF4349 domain-containing protein [Armatimonadota bacterium]